MVADMADIQSLLQGYSVETTRLRRQGGRFWRSAAFRNDGQCDPTPRLPHFGQHCGLPKVAGRGMEPVPHIAARNIQSKAELAAYLEGLVGEAGVTEVLVIGGGVGTPVGPYAETMDVLASGRLEAMGIRKVGVAGHPEGSPDISADGLATALAAKNEWATRTGIETYIETQFCFDVGAILKWEKSIRAEATCCRSISACPALPA